MKRGTRNAGRRRGAACLGALLAATAVPALLLAQASPPVPAASSPSLTNASSAAGPTDFGDVEAFLARVEAERKKGLGAETEQIARQWNGLLANDFTLLNAYKDAYASVKFEGTNKERASIKAWEEKNKAAFREEEFLAALRLHVRYLILTLMKRAGEDELAMKGTLEWLAAFPKDGERFRKVAGQDLLKRSLTDSPFVKAAEATRFVTGLANWATADLGDLPQIHRINVIGGLRALHDPRLFAEWDANLRLEEEAANREALVLKKQEFLRNRHPWVMWQAGKDFVAAGRVRQGVDLMVRALRENPRSDHYDAIVGEIRRAIADARQAKP